MVPVRTKSWLLDQLAEQQPLCLHVGLSVALGVLAISTLRMKCFWSPYICVLASVAVADRTLWSGLLGKVTKSTSDVTVNILRHIVLLCFISLLFNKYKPV